MQPKCCESSILAVFQQSNVLTVKSTHLKDNENNQGDIDVSIGTIPVLKHFQTCFIFMVPCFRPSDVAKQFIYGLLGGQLIRQTMQW